MNSFLNQDFYKHDIRSSFRQLQLADDRLSRPGLGLHEITSAFPQQQPGFLQAHSSENLLGPFLTRLSSRGNLVYFSVQAGSDRLCIGVQAHRPVAHDPND